jgi:hypothetical protein
LNALIFIKYPIWLVFFKNLNKILLWQNMSKIVKILTWPAKKLYSIASNLNTVLETPNAIKTGSERMYIFVTRFTGVTAGGAGLGKGTSDAIEAAVCGDGICFAVSCVGVAADTLQIVASFAPGPNVTMLVTQPISTGCKVFVWCCKRSSLPWGCRK